MDEVWTLNKSSGCASKKTKGFESRFPSRIRQHRQEHEGPDFGFLLGWRPAARLVDAGLLAAGLDRRCGFCSVNSTLRFFPSAAAARPNVANVMVVSLNVVDK